MVNRGRVLDFRVLNDRRSRGLINAIIGYCIREPSVNIIVDSAWMKEEVLNIGIAPERIIMLNWFRGLITLKGATVILPMQRMLWDVFLLHIMGLLKFNVIVHDLHYLSKRPLLTREFPGSLMFIKRLVYNYTIRHAQQVYVVSELVRRQISKCFNIKANKVIQLRVFVTEKPLPKDKTILYDYYLPLSERLYKGTWKIESLRFEKVDSRVAVSEQFYDAIRLRILERNPRVTLEKVSVKTDRELIDVYRSTSSVIYLSRHEGFGFVPYEAGFFGAIPLVINCSAYLSVPCTVFIKMRNTKILVVPDLAELNSLMATREYCGGFVRLLVRSSFSLGQKIR